MSDTPITDDVDRIVQLLIANYKTGWINGSECGTRIESEINKLRQLERENAALREQNENLASLLFRVLRKLDKNEPLRIDCLNYLEKAGHTANPFRAAIDAAREKEAQQ